MSEKFQYQPGAIVNITPEIREEMTWGDWNLGDLVCNWREESVFGVPVLDDAALTRLLLRMASPNDRNWTSLNRNYLLTRHARFDPAEGVDWARKEPYCYGAETGSAESYGWKDLLGLPNWKSLIATELVPVRSVDTN